MATYIKFYRGVKADVEAKTPAKGSVWFNTDNGSINIRVEKEGALDWESYSGYRDVSFSEGTLTFTKADGSVKTVDIFGFVGEDDFERFKTDQAEKDAVQSANIEKNTNNIADLLGDDRNEDGSPTTSVRQIVIDELANQLLAGGEDGETAGESFETLKELADWLEQHPDDAGTLNSTVNTHGTKIAELEGNVSELETSVSTINTTIEENELTTAAALTELDQRMDTIESTAITSIDGENHISVSINSGKWTIGATLGTLDGDTNGLATAADVKQYVDSSWEWGIFD